MTSRTYDKAALSQPGIDAVAAAGQVLRMSAERRYLDQVIELVAREMGAAGGRVWWRVRPEFPVNHWSSWNAKRENNRAYRDMAETWEPIWAGKEQCIYVDASSLPARVKSGRQDQTQAEVWALIPSGTRARGAALFWWHDDRAHASESDRELLREAMSAFTAQIWWRERWAQRKLERELLDETGRLLAQSFERNDVLQRIFQILRRVVHYDAGGIFLIHKETSEVSQIIETGYGAEAIDDLHLKIGQGLVGHVAKTGELVNVADVTEDDRYVEVRVEARSALVVPIEVRGRLLGVLAVESDHKATYGANDEWLLKAFGHQLAIALDRAELFEKQIEVQKLEQQLAVARSIQQSFLPQSAPELEGYDIAGYNVPSEYVGGDYFDFVPITGGQWGIGIADVSGKGIPAALIMAGFRAALIAEIRNNYAIREIFSKVNNVVYEMTPRDNFITAFYAVLDAPNRILTFSNAGHNPPLLLRESGEIERLVEGGPLMGVIKDARYEERPLHLKAGDLLLMYTDGVTEAMDKGGEEFGEERLIQYALDYRNKTAREIMHQIHAEVIEFSDKHLPNDDITLIVIKVL